MKAGASVVHQQVRHQAEAVDGRLELLRRVWLGQVEHDPLDADVVRGGDLVGDPPEAALVAAGQDKLHAAGAERPRERLADTRGGAGHERDAPGREEPLLSISLGTQTVLRLAGRTTDA